MKGKLSFAKLGKQADKGLESVGDAVFGKKSFAQKAADALESIGEKIEEAVDKGGEKIGGVLDKAGEKIDSTIDSFTLSSLESKLNRKHNNLQAQIIKRRDFLREQPGSIPADTLNVWVEQLTNMNNYIKDYPNSIWYFTDQQKIQATKEAIKAYEIIDKIIKNPNVPIKNHEVTILNIKDVNTQIGIFCIVLGLLVLGTLAFLATINPVVLTAYPVAIPAALSVLTGAIVLNQGINDNNFCHAFEKTTPRFFGKQDVSKSAKVIDAKQSGQNRVTFKK